MAIKCLIVDCIHKEAHHLQEVLEEADYHYDVVNKLGRKSGMEHIKENDMDIVFIRIDQPKIRGLEISREIRKKHSRTQLVWMARSETYALQVFQEGIDAFLPLPATPEGICNVISRLERLAVEGCRVG